MIIGITGTHGSGKDTLAEYLASDYGFANFSTSDEIRYEATARGLSTARPILHVISTELRTNLGRGVLAHRALERAKQSGKPNCAITAIRNVAEIETLNNETDKFLMLAVDAPVDLRYERTHGRARPGDVISKKDFIAEEERELANPDPNGQRIMECVAMSDKTFLNQRKNIKSLLPKLLKPQTRTKTSYLSLLYLS